MLLCVSRQCFLITTRRAPVISTSALCSPTAEITPLGSAVAANPVITVTARTASPKVSLHRTQGYYRLITASKNYN